MARNFLFSTETQTWEEQQDMTDAELMEVAPSMIFTKDNKGMFMQYEIDCLLNGGLLGGEDAQPNKRVWDYVWCPVHKKYECVNVSGHGIEDVSNTCNINKFCCHFDFLPSAELDCLTSAELVSRREAGNFMGKAVQAFSSLLSSNKEIWVDEKQLGSEPFCWQVQADEAGKVIVKAWILSIYEETFRKILGSDKTWSKLNVQKEVCSLEISPTKNSWKLYVTKQGTREEIEFYANYVHYHNISFDKMLPEKALEIVKEMITAQLQKFYGDRLRDYKAESLGELLNLVERPLNPEICRLRDWLYRDYKRILPVGSTDCCHDLCKAFAVEETQAVRDAYEKDYNYIFFYKFILNLGFSVEMADWVLSESIRRECIRQILGKELQGITNSISGEKLLQGFDKQYREESDYYDNLAFYFGIKIDALGEKVAAQKLLDEEYDLVYAGGMRWDCFMLLHRNWSRLAEDLKALIIHDGLTEEAMERLYREAEIL